MSLVLQNPVLDGLSVCRWLDITPAQVKARVGPLSKATVHELRAERAEARRQLQRTQQTLARIASRVDGALLLLQGAWRAPFSPNPTEAAAHTMLCEIGRAHV